MATSLYVKTLAIFSADFNPDPVSTTTVDSPDRIVPSARNRVNAADATALVGSA